MRILHIVHGYPPHGHGGAELYAEAVATRLARQWGDQIFVLTREHVESAPEFRIREEFRPGVSLFWINNTFRTTQRFEDTYVNHRITAQAARVIDRVRPDVAHIHHLTCLSTTIVDALTRRGIPVVLALHDYWLICHRGQLLDRSLARCDGPGDQGCARCIGAEGGGPALFGGSRGLRQFERALPRRLRGAVRGAARRVVAGTRSGDGGRRLSRQRLEHMRERFGQVSIGVAPSSHVRDRFIAAGFVQAPIVVSEYGVAAGSPTISSDHTGPLRLGYAGALMASKAPHLLADAVAMLPPASVVVDIYGTPAPYHGDDSYVRDLDNRLAHTAIRRHGALAHDRMPEALARLDALVFPSIWEETSGIGAREALAAGVPVIASRIGGVPETVRHDVNGLLHEPGDATDLARQIRRLIDEPGLLARLRSACHTPRTLDDDVRATRELYQGMATRAAPAATTTTVAVVVLNYRTPDQTALTVEMVRRSNMAPAAIVVVDNGDGVACRRAVAASSGDVKVVATGSNSGFSSGCNIGIREALATGATAVLLLNSDVVVPPDCLGRLVLALDQQPRPAIVAPVVRSRRWPDRVLSAGIDYDVETGRIRERLELANLAEVDAVSGCAMLVHRSVFDVVGLLPEEYFFSFEDIAFCHRARAAGLSVSLASTATVYHEGSATMGVDPQRLYYAARNHLHLGTQTPARSGWHRLRRQCAVVSYNLAHAITARGGSLPTRLFAVSRGVAHHLAGRYGEG